MYLSSRPFWYTGSLTVQQTCQQFSNASDVRVEHGFLNRLRQRTMASVGHPTSWNEMPLEYREISFSLEEIEELIHTYGEKFNPPIPVGLIVSASMQRSLETDENVLGINIRLDRHTGEKEYRELPLRLVSECLLLYCEDHDIPLPIQAKKILRTQNSRLILRVNIGKPSANLNGQEQILV